MLRPQALQSIGLRLGYILLSTIAGILLARALGPSEYGRYAFAIASANILVIIVQLGLPTLLVREFAIYSARNRWSLIRGLLRRSNQIVLLGSILVATGVATPLLALSPTADSKFFALLLAIPLVAFISLGNIRSASLRGLHHVFLGQLPEQLLRPLLLVLGVLTLTYIYDNHQFNANHAVLLNTAVAFVALIIGGITLWIYLPHEVKTSAATYETRRWTASVLPLTFIAGLNVIHSEASLVILGAISTSNEAGHFRIAMQGALFVSFAAPALDMALGPKISKLYELKELESLQRTITWAARFVFSFALPVFIIQVAIGKPLIQLVFGTAYSDAYPILLILAAGKLVTTATGSVGLILAMSSNERMMIIGSGIGVAVNVGLNLMLIPAYGAVGAAIATTLGTAAWYLALAYAVKRQTGLTSHPFAIIEKAT